MIICMRRDQMINYCVLCKLFGVSVLVSIAHIHTAMYTYTHKQILHLQNVLISYMHTQYDKHA